MAEEEHGLHVRRISAVDGTNRVFHRCDAVIAADVLANHAPAVANEILLEAAQLSGQIGCVSVVHDQNGRATIFHERRVEAHANVAIAVVARGALYDLVFIGGANRDVGINVTGCGARQVGY